MWKNFFYFTKAEKQGILFLIILIVVIVVVGNVPAWLHSEDVKAEDFEKVKSEYRNFLNTIKEVENNKPLPFHKQPQSQIVLSPFDPNTTDSVSLRGLGLSGRIAGNILKYRSKGGQFKTPEDFRKIYGLQEEQYQTLKPYIKIVNRNVQPKDTATSLAVRTQKIDTISRVFKYSAGTVINLNEADTTELKKIPGIGSGIANKIINYRKKLGGFYSVNQLADIEASKFIDWFMLADSSQISKINLNKAGLEKLKAHPYINFYQAKAIVEYRKKRGAIKNLKQLILLEEFTENDFERIGYYVCF